MFNDYLRTLPHNTLTEAVTNVYHVLMEASEGEAGKYFRKTIRSANPTTIQRLREDTIDLMSEECPDQPVENWAQWLWIWFRMDFGLRNSDTVYFAPGLARLVLCSTDSDEKFEYYPKDPLNPNADMLKKLVHYITMAHKDDYTRFLVDKETGEPATLESLSAKYGDALKKHGEKAMAELEQLEYTPNDYVIVELTDYDTASEYADYTEPDTWCYFEDEDTFDYYRNGGTVRLFLAYKPGFKDMKPGDKGYGQSMLGIDIGPDNALIHCNNRYNHDPDPELDNDKNPPGDNRFDAKELSLLLGGPYYKFCPYYTDEERKELGIMTPNDVKSALSRGEDIDRLVHTIHDMDDGSRIISVCDMYNVIKPDHTLLFDSWMTDIRPLYFKDGWNYKVDNHGRYSIFDTNGKQMIDDWYNGMWRNGGGSITVTKGGLQNLLGLDGKFKFKKWYQYIPDQINSNVYAVRFDGKIHFIDKDENLISDIAVDSLENFAGDMKYMIADISGKKNVMRMTDCKFMLEKWFKHWKQFESGTLTLIVYDEDNRVNLLCKADPTHYLLPIWANTILKLINGRYRISYDQPSGYTLYQVYDPMARKMLFDYYVDFVIDFKDSFDLKKDGKFMKIDIDGKPLYDHWKTREELWQDLLQHQEV